MKRIGVTVLTVAVCAGLVASGCSREKARSSERRAAATAATSAPVLRTVPAATKAMSPASLAEAQRLINRGIEFLVSQQDAEGGWSAGPKKAYRPALTALALHALLGHPDFPPDSPVARKGFDALLSYRQKNGSIYNPAEGQEAYTTAVAVMALKAAGDPRHNETIRAAVDFLKSLQIAPGQESPDGTMVEASDPRVGGVGYGKPPAYSPNLSVLGFVMDSWEAAGVPSDDPAVRNAAEFLTRLQNRSESNPMPFAKSGANDSGFIYGLSESKAGAEGEGGLRSYGTMTYIAFKQLLYAGVGREDPRVQGAYKWIRGHWTLESNPNMPGKQSLQGLYYYYHVFAKALRAWGEPVITDLDGKEHNWREELVGALAERVRSDGSWLNSADRWEERDPVLVTSYCVMALRETLKK